MRPLASLRLAVALLGLLAVVLAAATIYESAKGVEAAQRHFYQAYWFNLILLLLAVNVAAAAIVRWPWKPRQTGFVITHVAILLTLGGCLTTNWFGVTGQVVLVEGKQDSRVRQDGWVIQAASHGTGKHGPAVQVPISQPPRPGTTIPFQAGGESYSMQIVQYLENAEQEILLVEGAEKDPAGILVELKQSMPADGHHQHEMQATEQWLLVDDKGSWSIHSPGFTLTATSQYTPPAEAPAEGPAKGTLIATVDGQDHEIDVEQAMAAPVPFADGTASVHVIGYYEHASVGMGGKIQDDPNRPVNPAVMLELTTEGKTSKRIIFAKFGDISAMHGSAQEHRIKFALRHSGAKQTGMKVALVPQQDKWVLYEDNSQKLLQQAALAVGTEVTLKGMAVTLTVKTILPHAKPARRVVSRPLPSGGNPQPAVEVELSGPKGQYRDWLPWGQPTMFTMGSDAVRLTLQSRQYVLPFAIHLDKFELERYAGSQMPAMYRSEVTVIDTGSREKHSVTIEMNRPLRYKGWSFFQSSYSSSGGRNVSILAASKDPGKPIVYIGSILLVIGTAILAIQRLMAQVPTNGRNVAAAPTKENRVPVETKHA